MSHYKGAVQTLKRSVRLCVRPGMTIQKNLQFWNFKFQRRTVFQFILLSEAVQYINEYLLGRLIVWRKTTALKTLIFILCTHIHTLNWLNMRLIVTGKRIFPTDSPRTFSLRRNACETSPGGMSYTLGNSLHIEGTHHHCINRMFSAPLDFVFVIIQ